MDQVIQVVGALAIVGAYALAHFGYLEQHARSYLLLNLAGASVLAVHAYVEAQWGFFLLEVVWAAVSGHGLVRRIRAGSPPAARSAVVRVGLDRAVVERLHRAVVPRVRSLEGRDLVGAELDRLAHEEPAHAFGARRRGQAALVPVRHRARR
jgi:hypothetical protein